MSETATKVPNNRSRIPSFAERWVRGALRRLYVGKNVAYGSNLRLGIGSTVSSPHGLTIGDGVSIGQRSVIEVDGTIGNFCLLGRGVQIVGRMDHAIDEVGIPISLSTWVGDRDQVPRDSVEIGPDVWIGGGAVILGGVRIGEGSVVGAASIVTRDVEPYTIVAGNPARPVGRRFDSDLERQEHTRRLASIPSTSPADSR